MGSSPSKRNEQKQQESGKDEDKNTISRDRERDGRLRAKVHAMIMFNRHMTRLNPNPFRNRSEVHEFVKNTRQEDAALWSQIEKGGDDNKYSRCGEDDVVTTPGEEVPNEPHWKMRQEYGKCDLCHQLAANGYPCRICDRIFHKDCLENSGKYLKGEVSKFLEQANTYVGWSCFHCDDITHLLKEEEMREVMEMFERYQTTGRGNDAIVTWEEYKTYHQKTFENRTGKEMERSDVEILRQQFRLMDLDDNGFVSYYEFMTQEACLKLSARKTKDLVSILTDKEIGGAKHTFDSFDRDKDGKVVEKDVRETYFSWYTSLQDKSANKSKEMDDMITKHVENQTAIMFDDDARKKGALRWDDYIQKQALYILSSRPNRYTTTDYHVISPS